MCARLADTDVSVVVADDDDGEVRFFRNDYRGAARALLEEDIYLFCTVRNVYGLRNARVRNVRARRIIQRNNIESGRDVAGIMNLTLCAVTIARVIITSRIIIFIV